MKEDTKPQPAEAAPRRFRVVFIGPPGAGKGTQCQRLTQRYRIPHLSTGEMLRATKDGSALGRLVSSYIDGGRLAPDYLVMRIIIKRIAMDDCVGGCLFDGFPRTVNQAQMLDEHLKEGNEHVDAVLSLVADQETLVRRLLARAEKEDRADDNAETIMARLRVFHNQTAPVLDHYQNQGIVTHVDGLGAPDEVFSRIVDVLDAIVSDR